MRPSWQIASAPVLAERYRNRVIVVTGALGMIGSHITLALVEAGCSVLACDNADTSTRPPYLAGLELEGLISPEELDTWLQCASE